jgi:SAM-dependent methyltransferase
VLPKGLLDAASAPFRKVSRFAYHFARGKLGGDPAYRGLLQRGLLSGRDSLLDLGCGQGLIIGWLAAANRLKREGDWPADWPAPPSPKTVRGIELMQSDVDRAVKAYGEDCGIVQGDIRDAPFGSPDAVLILDVLHYLNDQAQRAVLKRIRASLPAGGKLLLRVGDAAGGLRFRYSQWVDQTIMLLRGHSWVRTHCRSIDEWLTVLADSGFEAAPLPMSEGTPFANVMLVSTAV